MEGYNFTKSRGLGCTEWPTSRDAQMKLYHYCETKWPAIVREGPHCVEVNIYEGSESSKSKVEQTTKGISSVSSTGEILPETNEVALSKLSKFVGTNLYLLHVVLLQCIEETMGKSDWPLVSFLEHFTLIPQIP
jgi:hypothetical protein